jgi:hypothetical protein
MKSTKFPSGETILKSGRTTVVFIKTGKKHPTVVVDSYKKRRVK